MFGFLRKIWDLARPYRGRLMLGVLTGIIGGLIEPLMVATVVFVYGSIFPSSASNPAQLKWAPEFVRQWAVSLQQSFSTSVQSHPGAVLALVGLIPLVILLRGVFSYLNVYFLQWTAIRTITDLRIRLFGHLMNLSAGFFSRTSTGELMSRVMNDTGTLQSIISNATAVMVKDPVTIVSLMGYLMWEESRRRLTLISMVVMPICMVPILVYNRKVRRASRELQTRSAELSRGMAESFTGNRVIKAYNLEDVAVQRFGDTARKFITHYMRIVRSSEIPGPMLEFVGAIGLCLVLLYLSVQGHAHPSASDFLAFIISIFAMYRPMKNLTRLYNSIEQARAASERVFELLATQNDLPEPAQPKPLRAAGAAIEFDAVDFSYGKSGCCIRSPSPFSPGNSSPWWARPVPARPRSPTCFCVSMTLSGARFGSVAPTSAR